MSHITVVRKFKKRCIAFNVTKIITLKIKFKKCNGKSIKQENTKIKQTNNTQTSGNLAHHVTLFVKFGIPISYHIWHYATMV